MEDVRKALAVSIVARGLSALLGLLALPIYLRFLGIEAYGVVGLFASMQVLVAFMDFGLHTTLTRQLAGGGREPPALREGRDAAATFERASFALAAAIGLMLAALAPVVASKWVNLNVLTAEQVTRALQLAALALACGWPTNLYSAGLAGLHRQLPLALSICAFSFVRVGLTVSALWLWPTLDSFFAAQLLASILQSIGTRIQLWRALTLPGHRPRPAWAALARSRRFAGGMTAIAITNILLMQMDKFILSYLLQLSDFGIYVIAGTLAAALYTLIDPFFTIIYPRLAALWASGDASATSSFYHSSSQVVAAMVMPAGFVLAFFPAQALFVVTADAGLSQAGAPILVCLVLGTALNGLMNVPYALQLAAGWTALTLRVNIAAVMILAPATWWAASRIGAAGAAAGWLLVNAGYVLITPQLMHRRLLKGEKGRWYLQGVVRPALCCGASACALAWIHAASPSRFMTATQLVIYWGLVTAVAIACLPAAREQLRGMRALAP